MSDGLLQPVTNDLWKLTDWKKKKILYASFHNWTFVW